MKKLKFLVLLLISGLFISGAAYAEGADNSNTLERISEKQDKIIQTLEQMKAELAIIKVRITQSQ